MAVELPPPVDVVYPAVLNGRRNGELPASILVAVPCLWGGPTVYLVEPAARCWKAWRAAGAKAGHQLKATDSYRSKADQIRLFTSRYQLDPIAGRPFRLWDSDNSGTPEKWYQKPGTAVVAVPGKSNHGWALALDAGEERDGDPGVESLDDATLRWMVATADDFGFSWEIDSEPWHVRCVIGDRIPAAVLAFEEGEGMDWKDLLPDPYKRQVQPGAAGDLLWVGTWHAFDAKVGVAEVKAAVAAGFAADEVRDRAQLAAIQALASAGGVDAAPIVAAVNAVRDEARVEYGRLHTEVAELKAENRALRERLAAAARVEADKLAEA